MKKENDLIPFGYGDKLIRVVKDENSGEPFWVAKDVCEILGYVNPRKALEKLDEDERGVTKCDTLGGTQEMSTINESGLYSLILRSNKPEAKPFKKWVTSEVLPTIRKTGSYSVGGMEATNDFTQFAIEMLKSNQEATQAIVKISDNVIKLFKNLSEIKDDVHEAKMDIGHIKKRSEDIMINTCTTISAVSAISESTHEVIDASFEIKSTADAIIKKLNRSTISAEEQVTLGEMITKRANGLKDKYDHLGVKYITMILWTKLNEKMNVNTYRDIKAEDFIKALRVIDHLDIAREEL